MITNMIKKTINGYDFLCKKYWGELVNEVSVWYVVDSIIVI